jgi:low molecular weight protein-tyrosine phosphatase
VAAVIGSPMHPAGRAALAHFGVPESAATSFRARRLTTSDLAAADLILGAAPSHRAELLRYRPQALPNAFTIREFARLVELVDLDRLPTDPLLRARALVRAARAARGTAPPGSPDADTVPDPIRGSAHHHLESAGICAEALRVTFAALEPWVGAALRPSTGLVT